MSLKKRKLPKFYPNKSENRCAYRNCNSRRGDKGIILFCFPNRKTNTKKYEKWCHNSGLKKETNVWRIMICNNHFNGEDYTTHEHQKLLARAIPIDYRLVEKDIHHPFDPTKVEKVYTNNMCANILNLIKTEITEDDSDINEHSSFDPTKVKRVYTSNHCPKITKVIKNEIIDNDSDTKKDVQHKVQRVYTNYSCTNVINIIKSEIMVDDSDTENITNIIKSELIVDESETETSIFPD